MAWALLVVGTICALLTVNGIRPPRRPDVLATLSFFPGWLTSELPFHLLVCEAVAVTVLVGLGALDDRAGWAGLALILASSFGLVVIIRQSLGSSAEIERALRDGLGDRYRSDVDAPLAAPMPLRWRQIAWPFQLRDARVHIDRDVPYKSTGSKAHRVNVYRRADGRTGCPTLLFLHGGAWVFGDKREQGIPFMLHLAAHGWVCVTANYRLSPKATFPDHLIDVKDALRWVREHAAEYGADPDFVVVSGASAGGHLAALVALTANEPAYQPGFEDVDTTVQGCVCWYGVYDLTNRVGARGRGFARFIERTLLKVRFADDAGAFAAASPVDRVHPGAPPTMIVQGSNDTLVPPAEARLFADTLRRTSSSPVVYAEISGAQHAFEVFRSVRALHAVHGAGRFCGYVHATAPIVGPE